VNCREIQEYCVACAGEEIPAEMKVHMASCKECRETYEAALTVARLVSLKKFEAPDPGFEARSLARIRTSLYAMEEERAQGWSIWKLFDRQNVAAYRYAMAAMVLFVGGLYMVSLTSVPTVDPLAMQEPAAVPEAPSAPPAVELAPAPANQDSNAAAIAAVPVLLAFSNARPGRVEYGPGPSMPVRYDY
jgi:hypothetical protein